VAVLDPGTTGIIVMAMMGFMLAVGVHIGVALGLGGILGMYLAIGPNAAWAQLATVPFSTTNSFNLAVIPLFILMGALATQAGLTKDLYKAAYNWLGKMSGGLAMATTLASAAFGAACGSTIVNAAVFTKMAMPEISLIPPSILMVIYAVITEQSVARLLVAGLIPGLLSAAIYMLGIYIRVKRNPKIAPIPDINVSRAEKWRSLRGVWGISFLFILVIGGIYLGFFVPTYAGAVGAFGAFMIVVGKGRLNRRMLVETFKDAGITTSTIFIIVIGGILFARFLTYTGLVTDISDWLLALGLPPMYLMAFAVIYLILGMLIDPIAIMVMTLPVMFPIMVGVGYDPIWLGVIAIKLAEISLITPPVGLNVYVVRSASPVPLTLEDVFAGIMPFLLLDVITLALLIAFPAIVLFLPNLMM
jgi:TRAP-type C4-dicarboxylate transport system permease large subunit